MKFWVDARNMHSMLSDTSIVVRLTAMKGNVIISAIGLHKCYRKFSWENLHHGRKRALLAEPGPSAARGGQVLQSVSYNLVVATKANSIG